MTMPEKVYDSGPQQPEDELWLAQGRKMVEDSLPAVREAARGMLTGLGALQGIYVAILGFGEAGTKFTIPGGVIAALPLVAWMVALLLCLRAMMTDPQRISLLSPEDIRANHEQTLATKQGHLRLAFWWLGIGLLAAFVVIVWRPSLIGE